MTSAISFEARQWSTDVGAEMSDVPDIRTQLLEALNRIAEGRDNAETLTKNLRKALLDFASETPDNVNCTERTEVGSVGTGVGLKLQVRKLLFS